MLKELQVMLTTVKLSTDGFKPLTCYRRPSRWSSWGERIIELGTDSVLFYKENLLNIGFRHLPEDAEYVAWIDADVAFTNPNWVSDTIDALKENDIVQPFSQQSDLSWDGNHILNNVQCFPEWLKEQVTYRLLRSRYEYYGDSASPAYGFAWAATSEFLKRVGGLGDTAIVGSGDFCGDWALVNQVERAFNNSLSEGYKKPWYEWQEKAAGTNMSFIPGLLLHYWHGTRETRKYVGRLGILEKYNFDPYVYLERDPNGLWRIKTNAPNGCELQRDIMEYFESRKEDE
jgi:hypothetical protein